MSNMVECPKCGDEIDAVEVAKTDYCPCDKDCSFAHLQYHARE